MTDRALLSDSTDLLEGLNPSQREAAAAVDGPVLVVAGAGSGKTRVLTHRIAHLIRDLGVSPHALLAITFTNKAADEMKERVAALLGTDVAAGMWVSTFHSACVRILRREATRLGYKNRFTIYDDADSLRLVTLTVKDLDLDPKRFPPKRIRAAISNAKNELVDFESFAEQGNGFYHEHAADVYRLYQQRLVEASAMDFDDLLMVTVELFSAFPDVLGHYQDRFQYVMVDEYQDTNHAQYVLVRQLTEKHRNLCVVGDSDQSIYAFRGADIRNILEFERDYEDARVVLLQQNYRSSQRILEVANGVIRNNPQPNPKFLWSDRGLGDKIVRYEAEDEHDEAGFIADQVGVLEPHFGLDQMAVFYRTNAQSRVIEEVFVRYGIPYNVVGGTKFYDRKEIKDVLAYLRTVINPADQVAVKRIVNVPKRGIGQTTIAHVDRFAEVERITFYEALTRAEEIPQLSGRAVNQIKDFVALIELLVEIGDGGPRAATDAILRETGYLDELQAERTIEALGRVENLQELVSVAEQFEEGNEGAVVGDERWDDMDGLRRVDLFLESVSLVADIDDLDQGSRAVTLMTLHNAKGLEFPVIFMAGMEDGVFPHMRSLGDPAQLEEERRLCYVGITRAMDRLFMTHAWKRMLFGSTNFNAPSRFLAELPDEHVDKADRRTRDPAREGIAAAPHSSGVELASGDRVLHDKWGLGTVREVAGTGDRAEAAVDFDDEGEKRLLVAWAPLKKV